ncbi:MAG TPA: prolyl oligopeptidase family serine peptidase [Usitatibacteraceae bacterium]|nr:prolyl oligopeptidase family serine peptidase [Usitatibacteraceae bacterium]
MKWIRRVLLALLLVAGGIVALAYGVALRGDRPVGFQVTRVTDTDGQSFAMGVWYPTQDRAWPTAQVGVVLMEVAQDAPVSGKGLPLVVLSHGNGGGLQSHADLALKLASAGYVVAAPMHPGDNFLDQASAGSAKLFSDRNRQFRLAVDHMLSKWPERASIDPEKVGAFGFSAGGFTVLTAIGARPDLGLIATQCAKSPEFVCDVLRHFKSPLLEAGAPHGDAMEPSRRLKAAVVAAPGLGFTFGPDAMEGVQVPLQLWSGDKDDRVPYATNAGVIAAALGPRVESQRVPGASHVSFLVPCGLLRPAEICKDPEGFDRKTFHAGMNAAVLKFFDKALGR